MPVAIGSGSPSALYIGSTRVSKLYLGSTLLFNETYIVTQSSEPLATQTSDVFVTQDSTKLSM